MESLLEWKRAAIRKELHKLDLANRIYCANGYYTAQLINYPAKEVLAKLNKLAYGRVVVKQSRIDVGNLTLLNPEAFYNGYRINVFF